MTAIKSVDIQTMQQWQNSGEAILVDIREPEEHAEASIPGAILLPMAQVSKAALLALGGKRWVLHCRSGGRSTRVCSQLLSEDPLFEVYNLDGGIRAWLELVNK